MGFKIRLKSEQKKAIRQLYEGKAVYIWYILKCELFIKGKNEKYQFAIPKSRKRPGNSEVDNASCDCFRGRKQKARPKKLSRDALSTPLLPGLLRNSEMANR